MTTPAAAPAKLDPVDVLSRTFKTYGTNFAVLFPIALGVYLIPIAIGVAIGGTIGIVLLFVLLIAAATAFTAVVVELVRDVEDGTLDSSIGDLVKTAAPLLLPILGLSIVQGLAVGIGFVLIIVPGLFLLTIWAVTVPVLVLERRPVFETFSRSQQLVKGNGWQVFGVIVAVQVISQVFQRVVSSAASGSSLIVLVVVLWLVSAAIAPIVAISSSVLYLRLRDAHGEPPLPTGKATPKGPQAVI